MGQVAGTRRRGPDSLTSRILLGLGFVLAVAASLFVVLADEVRWLRLAVLLALWAALLAAFAVARYRREARTAELRQDEMTRIYELELHREVAARREYEVQLAETTRAELETRHDADLVALREQIERLTSVLSGFMDGDVLVERLTLSAEATRIRSVGDGRSSQAIGSVTRQLVDSTVGPAGTGSAWGPQPPPIPGPLPPLPPVDASAGAVTEQVPQIVEPVAPAPVIDAVAAPPRVVGDPHQPSGERVEAGTPADVPNRDDGGSTDDRGPHAGSPEADSPEPADTESVDLVEVEHGATEPEPEPEPEPDVEAGPAAPEFRPATDVPDAPARGDSPATAWTLRHRLDTPAAAPIERTSGPRRAAGAAAATEEQPSAAIAEITNGAKDPSGHSSGVSVAELLAAYGGSVPPRRRRQSDDA